jgi:hypothetical protein
MVQQAQSRVEHGIGVTEVATCTLKPLDSSYFKRLVS